MVYVSSNPSQYSHSPRSRIFLTPPVVFFQLVVLIRPLAGSGKTVLCSTVIEAIKSMCESLPGRRIAYFYFDFWNTEKQRTDFFMRSIIRQLLAHESQVPDLI
jgi:hypothetical protein